VLLYVCATRCTCGCKVRTFIVGKRYPTLLGAQVAQAQRIVAQAHSTAQVQHAVVSRGFAGALQGYKANGAHKGNGTLYGVFASAAQAYAYQKTHRMQLYTSVLPW
jgi:hypothetical protein